MTDNSTAKTKKPGPKFTSSPQLYSARGGRRMKKAVEQMTRVWNRKLTAAERGAVAYFLISGVSRD